MAAILLIDDDKDTWEAVRLVLEPQVKVYTIDSLVGALNFLRTRLHEVSGVIVDLNLTEGTDNFGREILERLREIEMPCIIFSKSIRTRADAQRYANEFGVLGTIGKESNTTEENVPIQQLLRESVDRMLKVSVEQRRERIRAEIERELTKRDSDIENELHQSEILIAETKRVAGASAADKLANMEAARFDSLVTDAKSFRDLVIIDLQKAKTMDELERIHTETMQTLGISG